jgi:hypothetical protein
VNDGEGHFRKFTSDVPTTSLHSDDVCNGKDKEDPALFVVSIHCGSYIE